MPTAMRRRVERFGAADVAVHGVDWVTIPAVVSCTMYGVGVGMRD